MRLSAYPPVKGSANSDMLQHTHTLWVQQAVRSGAIELRKVRGDINPADLFTKHLSSRERVTNLTELFGCEFREGRPERAPQLRKNKGSEVHTISDRRNGGHTRQHLATPHDTEMLPHQHPKDALDELFPRADVVDEVEETEPDATWDAYRRPTTLPARGAGGDATRKPERTSSKTGGTAPRMCEN